MAAVVVSRLPFVSAIGTVAHEAGHALAADVLTGDVVSITVFRSGGGVTFSTASDSAWRSFLVSGAGYPATLLAGLALLTAVLLGKRSQLVALAGSFAALFALVFWTPFNSHVPGQVTDGDQRFTWIVLLLSAAALAGAAFLPQRFDTARRITLGAFAVGLLGDAFRAGKDLVTIEGRFGATVTDADGLAAAAGVLPATAWAWLMRLALLVIAAGWAVAVVRVRQRSNVPEPWA